MNKIIRFCSTNFCKQAILIIGLTVIAYGLLINNINLWSDEIYSVLMAKDSFSDMWQLLITEDSKPPLYYIYLKAILAIFPQTYEIAAAHFSSFILLIAAQVFAATEIRHDYGDKVSLWMMGLLALLPYSLWLALEVRTYMLSSLLMTMAAVYGLRLFCAPKIMDFIKFGIVSVLALYSHYYCALWLMFLYGFILLFIFLDKKWGKIGKPFMMTALCVAICFTPWLYIPLQTATNINKVWYVNLDFVRFSWQFFTNPLPPEIIQSIFFLATTFATSVFSFILLFGLTQIKQLPQTEQRAFIIIFGSFIFTYALLLILSYTIRPIVTARYLKIFSVSLYLAAAIILAKYQNLRNSVLVASLMGFVFTYADIRAISFDKGYQTAINEIKTYIPRNQPLLTTDNSNLFCEYYLPEYDCLHLVSDNGEILRYPSIIKKISQYGFVPHGSMFSISIFSRLSVADECNEYNSNYRYGQNLNICRFDNEKLIVDLLQQSRQIIIEKAQR